MNKRVVLISSETLGKGDDELGKVILENFLVNIKKNPPQVIFLMNSGVKLATESSLLSVHLEELHNNGVQVLSCKTCVDHFGIEEDIIAGEISTMTYFAELTVDHNIITL